MAYNVTVAEAAKRLGVSVQAVYKRIHQGTLDAIQINHRWLLSGEEGSICIAPPAGRPRKGDAYILMNATHPVMEFNYRAGDGSFKPFKVIDAQRAPLGTVTRTGRGNADGLRSWWDHRTIPSSREQLDAKLAQLGLETPQEIPFRNLGLSLSDQYWICPAGVDVDWHNINYFENSFGPSTGTDTDSAAPLWDDWLAEVGLSSPDNTSEGVLPKRWVCNGSKRMLIKGCNPWCDQQPVNEAVATALQRRILQDGDYVPYSLLKDAKGEIVACNCECFLDSCEEYIPASLVLGTQGKYDGEPDYDALLRIGGNLGMQRAELETFLSKMIVCDSIMANSDRHLRNFGFIRDVETLRFRPAPLFDYGNSLWYGADESTVAQRNWSFNAKPFDAVPNRQLYLAGKMDWLDLQALDGFADEAATLLEESIFALPRVDFIREGIQKRIDAVLSMRG